jgi:hypothetical protein
MIANDVRLNPLIKLCFGIANRMISISLFDFDILFMDNTYSLKDVQTLTGWLGLHGLN